MLFGTTEVIGAVWHIQKYTNNKNVDLNFNKIKTTLQYIINSIKESDKRNDLFERSRKTYDCFFFQFVIYIYNKSFL